MFSRIAVAALCTAVLATSAWAANWAEGDWSGGEPGSDASVTVEKTEAGPKFTLKMGSERVNWNNARWSVQEFDEPVDLTEAGGMALEVRTDQPRDDAGVYLALKEADGSWYYVGWAAELDEEVNGNVVQFDDFRVTEWSSPAGGNHHDENQLFDREEITAVAIGSINPLGVGDVQFTLTGLAPVPAGDDGQSDPVRVDVTGEWLSVNGTEMIPYGVFGTFAQRDKSRLPRYRIGMQRHLFGTPNEHWTPVTNIQLHCYGERTQTAPRIYKGNWKQELENAARNWAKTGKESGKAQYVEFWNEPYLNWANKNRLNFNPDHYQKDKAEEGGEVHFKSDGSVARHLRWTKDFDA
ncbi:MAG: hypothetical protein ACOC93_00760, partial [Planctomycetota bacterium]